SAHVPANDSVPSGRNRRRCGSARARPRRAPSTTRRTTSGTMSSNCDRRIRSGSTSARAIPFVRPHSPTRSGPASTRTSGRAGTTPHSGTASRRSSYASSPVPAPDPKIELHVHLEGTVRPDTLRAIAKRNDYALPDDLESLYRFRDFAHFIEVWILTTNALRTADDFRQVVTGYAEEAASHGCVYLEGIFSPAERVRRGCVWDDVYEGVCNGAAEARERHGVEVRLTPDIPRGFTQEEARATVEWAARFR